MHLDHSSLGECSFTMSASQGPVVQNHTLPQQWLKNNFIPFFNNRQILFYIIRHEVNKHLPPTLLTNPHLPTAPESKHAQLHRHQGTRTGHLYSHWKQTTPGFGYKRLRPLRLSPPAVQLSLSPPLSAWLAINQPVKHQLDGIETNIWELFQEEGAEWISVCHTPTSQPSTKHELCYGGLRRPWHFPQKCIKTISMSSIWTILQLLLLDHVMWRNYASGKRYS